MDPVPVPFPSKTSFLSSDSQVLPHSCNTSFWSFLYSLTCGNNSHKISGSYGKFFSVNTMLFISSRRRFWWLKLLNVEDFPDVQLLRWIINFLCLCFYCLQCLGTVLLFAQLDLHEAFTVGWNPGIKELHEEISQLYEITQYHKATWNERSRGWSQITLAAGLGHRPTQYFTKIYSQTHVLDIPFKIFNPHRMMQSIGMTVDFCYPIFFCFCFWFVCLFERNASISRENVLMAGCLWEKKKELSCTPNTLS